MRVKIKIKNSTVCLGGLLDAPLVKALEKFDLANATPLDCMAFIRKLKEMYGDVAATRLQ